MNMSATSAENLNSAAGPRQGLPRAVFVIGRFSSALSGLERCAADMANVLYRSGMPVSVFGVSCAGSRLIPGMFESPCAAPPGRWLGGLCASAALRRMLDEAVPLADLVHNHTVWMLPNHYASAAARRAGKPVLFTPHGTLDPYAVRMSRWKKRIVAACFQNRDFRQAACFHVFTQRELEGIRSYGLRVPVAVVPYGIDLAALDARPGPSALAEKLPQTAGKAVCLYLSRLHRKKGLEHLVQAWRQLAGDFPAWHLVIAGPDYGMDVPLRRMIAADGLQGSITVTGPLSPPDKLAALAAASAFVLPSFSEGFSMAVLEALACRLPVLITPGCNFPDVAAQAAGVEVAPHAAATAAGLRHLLALTPAERRAMGQRGRALVEASYTWDAVLGKMHALYHWLCGGGAPPAFVATD